MLVKPNIWPQLPPDVANYRAANPSFPQQTTLDQFFDEAQWESYYALGCALGHEAFEALDRTSHAGLATTIDRLFRDDDEAVTHALERRYASKQRELRRSVGARLLALFGKPASNNAAPVPPGDVSAKPATARFVARLGVGAVNASIGLGAAATIAISAYQAIDSFANARAQKVKDERTALKEIADLWAKLPPPLALAASRPVDSGSPAWRIEVEAPAALAAALARTSDTLCQADQADWFKQSPLAAGVFQDALVACKTSLPGHLSASCDWLVKKAESPSAPSCLYQQAGPVVCEPRYWGYHYEVTDVQRCVAPKLAERQVIETSRLAARKAAADALAATTEAQRLERASAGSPQAAAASQAAASAVAIAVRAASSASAAVADAAAPAALVDQVCQPPTPAACCGKTVFVQVFGRSDRDQARSLRPTLRGIGASVPPIDDVIASARARNRIAPSLPSAVSVRYSDAAALACAEGVLDIVRKATGAVGQVQRLADTYTQRPDQVELWLPPSFMQRSSPAALGISPPPFVPAPN
jgi:hypothetical protein